MIIQLIFFIALAAFIIIFAHRYSLRSEGFRRILTSVVTALGAAAGWLIGLLRKVKLPTPRRSRRQRESFGATKVLSNQSDAPTDHAFWASEALADKPDISSHFEEGEQLFRRGKHKEAEQFFLKAAANNPGDAKVYARLGLLYLEQKNYSDAIESLKVAVKLEKYNPSRHYNLALAYWGNKDTRRAISCVREAIGLDPVTEKYRKLLEQLLNG